MKYVTTCEPEVDEKSHKELLFYFLKYYKCG